MSEWSLPELLAGLHDDIQERLGRVRKSFGHPGVKGDASEGVWLELLKTYLPQRYQAATAHVVDSLGAFSEQIDIVVFDRQYSPFIFIYQGQTIIPAESVYAVFEAKQTMNAVQGELCTEEGGERAPPASNESSNSLRKGDLSGEAAHSDFRRDADIRERLVPSTRGAVSKGDYPDYLTNSSPLPISIG